MAFDVLVDACEIRLVDHRKLDFPRRVAVIWFRGYSGQDEVERALEDRSVGDGFDTVEGVVREGFFEAPDDAGGEEE